MVIINSSACYPVIVQILGLLVWSFTMELQKPVQKPEKTKMFYSQNIKTILTGVFQIHTKGCGFSLSVFR